MGFFKNFFNKPLDILFSPVAGNTVSITEVPDPVFAKGMLGNGIAILPSEGKVYAPCNATVDTMFETGHAVSLVTGSGAEVLIHVGIDTVILKGKHFTVHHKNGDQVQKGDLLIEFDQAAIQADGFDTITSMLVCNSDDFGTFKTHIGKTVTNADIIIELAR